ncbi:MAG: phospholipid carrier-dependent glycosyltransferase [Chloroflexi bacterium]|nr:phospholipid carrier-dependent glycosyltransferase [Chloroflexota bacterium]
MNSHTASPSRSMPRFLEPLIAHKLALLLALCVIVRVGALVALPGIFDFVSTGAIHGSSSFDAYATNLLTTGVYGITPGVADATLPPLYGYVLAGVYGIFGRGYWQVGLFHTLLDTASIAMLYMIGKRLFQNEWVGWLAGVFTALYPYLVFQNLTLIDTPIFITELHAFILIMVLLRERNPRDRITWGLAILGGLVLGIATLTRPILLPLAAFVGLWFLFKRSLIDSILRLLPVAVLTALVLVPWILRNEAVYHAFVPTSISGGSNFYQGNNPDVIPFLQAGYDVQWTGPDKPDDAPNALTGDNENMQLALDWLRANPNLIPELLWTKFLTHWSIDIFPRLNPTAGEVPLQNYQGDAQRNTDAQGDTTLGGLPPDDPVSLYNDSEFGAARVIHRFYFGGLLLLALIGVVLTIKRWRDVALLWFVQISMTIIYVVFHPSTRYRVPSDPLLFLFSACTLITIWGRIRELI